MRRAKPPTAAQARDIANQVIDGLPSTPLERWQRKMADVDAAVAESFRLDIDSDESVPSENIVADLQDLLEELS